MNHIRPFRSILSILFALSFGCSAFASPLAPEFSGRYSGTGSASDADGWEAPCTSVSITIVDAEDKVEIRDQAFSCGAIGGTHQAVVLLKKPDGLYLKDKKVGTCDEKGINFLLADEHVNDVDIVVRLNLKADQLIYREDWLSLDESGGYDQTFDMQSSLHKN